MKILKKILLVIAILIAIPLIAALFISRDYTVAREVTVNKANETVFNYIRFQRNQEQYSRWVMQDPVMQKEYRGTDGDVGFVYAWDSKEMGKGEQEIKQVTDGKEVRTELRFEKPMKSVAQTSMITQPVAENQTRVQWRMEGRSSYPFNFMNLFMDGILGKDMEQS